MSKLPAARIALFLFLAVSALADNQLPLTCTASISAAPKIRSEGLNELVGDLVLTCTGGTSTPAGQPVPTADFALSFNTAVTNAPFIPNGSAPFTDALLLIGDPPPASQNFAPVTAASGLSFTGSLTGNGTGLNFASGAVPNMFAGSTRNVNSLQWLGVPIDPPSAGGPLTFRATNIRVNAAAVGGGLVTVLVNINSLYPFVTNGAGFDTSLVDANAGSGVTGSFFPGSASHQFSLNPSLFAPSPSVPSGSGFPYVNFTEAFPGAFKTPSAGPQNVPGQIYNTDAGFTGPSFNNPAGLADFGTRLKATFNNIPSGVRIFVSTAGVTGSTGTAQLVSTNTPAGTTGIAELPVASGTASAVWEVQTANPGTIDTLRFNVYPSFFSGGTLQTAPPAPTNITVSQGFDSATGGPTFLPLPTVQPPTLFTINSATGLTPQLSVTVDPRKCTLGNPWRDPLNSCGAGDGPRVSVTSDSGPLTPFFSASNTGGVQITGTLTGATPASMVLGVSAPGVAAGVYPQTLTFTAGGATAVQVPFNVTVLPDNNPVIFAGGITDALSFRSGAIVPGEIFAAFGSNFGPAGLVSGTVDSQGKVSTSVANTQMTFDGVAAPLLYVAPNQLSGIAPFGLKGKTTTQAQIIYNGLTSPPQTLTIANATLSMNSANGSGGGGGVIINKDGTVNSATNRASVGDTVVIYGSYAGPFANNITGTDGRTTTGAPYPAPAGTALVKMGGIPATNIPYFGNAPTLVESAIQVNVVIPAGVKPGASVPITLSAGGVESAPGMTIAIK